MYNHQDQQNYHQQQIHYSNLTTQQEDHHYSKRKANFCCCIDLKVSPIVIGCFDIFYFIGMVILLIQLRETTIFNYMTLTNVLATCLPRVVAFAYFMIQRKSQGASAILFWVRSFSCIPITIIFTYISVLIFSIHTDPNNPSDSDGLTYAIKYILIIIFVVPQAILLSLDYYFSCVLKRFKNEMF
ncbi:UNKNOWN [Stylonychia lemnae]|uniref:Transmembrane protein n=1 Tax=Stylonychia lemnae TaxID=5949 RepID=A0A077ZT29_STYLE|nr:UNKNOWN [Stylonychia lemnae]|eukprot:CDW73043.1 UNKNOWN [Stylonychia lemnae]